MSSSRTISTAFTCRCRRDSRSNIAMRIRKFCLALPVMACGLMLGVNLAKADDSLYRDLGQHAGIAQIVNHMLAHVLADDRVKEYFSDTNIDRLKGMLVDYFQ